MQGAQISSPGTNHFWLEPPYRLRLEFFMSLVSEEMRLELIRNDTNLWIYAPETQTYIHRTVTNSLAETLSYFAKNAGPNLDDTLYRFLVVKGPRSDPGTAIRMESSQGQGMRFLAQQREGKRMVNIFEWQRRTFTSSGEATNAPVSAWVDPLTGLVRRLRTDYTGVLTETAVAGRPGTIPMQKMVVDVLHQDPEINPPPFPADTFKFSPPPGAKQVQNFSELNRFGGRRMGRPEGRPDTRADRQPGSRDSMDVRPVIPPRSPGVERHLVDISHFYNAALSDSWLDPAAKFDLSALSPGAHRIDGIEFDVRGIIQLTGTATPRWATQFPKQITGIQINQRCRRIHFLHGASGSSTPGTHIGSFLVHYEDGQDRLVPVVYGYDVRDWLGQTTPEEQARGIRPSWTGTNSLGTPIQLFHHTWWNPRMDADIRSLDFLSTQSAPAPFLLAVTIEE
jgi:hypothetical protein